MMKVDKHILSPSYRSLVPSLGGQKPKSLSTEWWGQKPDESDFLKMITDPFYSKIIRKHGRCCANENIFFTCSAGKEVIHLWLQLLDSGVEHHAHGKLAVPTDQGVNDFNSTLAYTFLGELGSISQSALTCRLLGDVTELLLLLLLLFRNLCQLLPPNHQIPSLILLWK